MAKEIPSIDKFADMEEAILSSRLTAIRSVVEHSGEKGRALEEVVATLVRDVLPLEYGVSTGFVVYHSDTGPRLSPQLDIIIYDALRGGPICRLDACDVFPLESVYGYIEVKATITTSSDDADKYADNSIESCIQRNHELRQMITRRYWTPVPDSQAKAIIMRFPWMPIRSYVFGFSPSGTIAKSPPDFARRMSDFMKRTGDPAHLHGVYMVGSAFYETLAAESDAVDEDKFRVRYTTSHHLAAFKASFLHSFNRFQRHHSSWSPAIDKYITKNHEWRGDVGWTMDPTSSADEFD